MATPDNNEEQIREPGWKARRTPSEEQLSPDAWAAGSNWIFQKWQGQGTPGCPYCGTHEWWVGNPVELSTVTGLGAAPPMFPVTCKNCGQTVFVNALVAGFKPGTENLDTESQS